MEIAPLIECLRGDRAVDSDHRAAGGDPAGFRARPYRGSDKAPASGRQITRKLETMLSWRRFDFCR